MTPKGMIHLSDGYMRKFHEDAQEAITLLRQIMSLGVKKKPPEVVEA
jgi:hypothetical protein